jgi:hypothetical protein
MINNKVIDDRNFTILYQTDKLIAGAIFENAYLIKLQPYQEIAMGDFYGDPSCAVIDEENKWCLIGGNTLTIWRVHDGCIHIDDENIKWLAQMRQTSSFTVELLVEGIANNKMSIWEIDINSSNRTKIRDIEKGLKTVDTIDW